MPAHADVRETLEEAGLVVTTGEEISHYTNPDTNGRPLTFLTLTYRVYESDPNREVMLTPD
jgi:8-oxo-dGTP pyrophosphatase MutT (NUDIX family)